MGFLQRLFGTDQRTSMRPLYDAVIAEARRPDWFRDGGVPDTLDGRFDMVAMVMALVLDRLHEAGDAARAQSVALTEVFVHDMDGQLREAGIGDFVVGKHVGKMMGALGGRLAAYRAGLEDGGDLEDALTRNLYRGARPEPARLAWSAAALRELATRIAATPLDTLLAGRLAA